MEKGQKMKTILFLLISKFILTGLKRQMEDHKSSKVGLLQSQMDIKEKEYYFLFNYTVKSDQKTYSFLGFNCLLQPCYQFEYKDQVSIFFRGKLGWETCDGNGKPDGFCEYKILGQPTSFLAPEIDDLVKKYNSHILEEIKYLDWKLFVVQKRKLEEFRFVVLCINRVKIHLPPEIIFFILSFVKGWELLFEPEILTIQESKKITRFQLSLDHFPELGDVY